MNWACCLQQIVQKYKMEQKTLIGTVAIISMILAGTVGVILSPDTIYYECKSKGLVSDCINGVKADGLRCYYSQENTRKYTYCAEGWVEYHPQLEEEKPNKIHRESSYICTVEGCEV